MTPVYIARQAQERFTAQGARSKEKQSMRYDVQLCTEYLGPCTVCGAIQGDYEANGVLRLSLRTVSLSKGSK